MKTKHSIKKSNELWERALKIIPAGTQTLSKGPTQFVDGVAPKYLAKGKGCHVWDVDGNQYIDFPMALGPVILGYQYPATDKAIVRQLRDGITFSLMHPLEVEIAELLRDLIPCAEMVRFGKNGSDVTTAAIRLARAYTGREKIAHCGYHGWHDWYVASTTRTKGVPKACFDQQYPFEYNNIVSLKKIFTANPGQIAVVIMEPLVLTLPENNFLQKVKEAAHENGAILIFDEVASGFRYEIGGVHQYFDVNPDLACFGKAMANGMPMGALVGRREIMKVLDEVFFSFTFGGECLSLAAAKATILEMKKKKVIPYLWKLGERLKVEFNKLIKKAGLDNLVQCSGFGPRTYVVFSNFKEVPSLIVKSLFQQEVIKRGVLFNGVHLMTFSHTNKDIDRTLKAYEAALDVLRKAVTDGNMEAKIEGRSIQPVFRPIS